jgi:hypothetical protein
MEALGADERELRAKKPGMTLENGNTLGEPIDPMRA